MRKTMFALIIIILFSVSLAGWGKADMQGIIVDINESSVWFANGLSLERYEETKEHILPIIEEAEEDLIVKQDVRDSVDNFELLDLKYVNVNEFEKGDEVNVWLSVDGSSTTQAEASKVALKE